MSFIFESFFYEKVLKLLMLSPGFWVVCGQQGAGKTSFVTALLAWEYKYHNAERLGAARKHIYDLNRYYGYNLSVPEHLYFSNIEIGLNGPLNNAKTVRTHYINTQNFGLPNSDYDVQYFPYGSVVYISEADMLMYCQDWNKMSKYLWSLVKYVRHNGMTVIFDMQIYSRLAIQLRLLVTDLIYIDFSHYTKPRFFGLLKGDTTWYFSWAKPQQLEQQKESIKLGITKASKDLNVRKRFKYKSKLKIYDQYDSYSGEMYFLHGIENKGYTVQTHPEMNYSPSGVEKYCEMLPLVAPPADDKK